MWSAHNPKSDTRAHACVHMNISDVSKWNGSRQCKGKPFPCQIIHRPESSCRWKQSKRPYKTELMLSLSHVLRRRSTLCTTSAMI